MLPVLIFLHGLLGTKEDWQPVIAQLPHFHCIALNLPYHGEAKTVQIHNFDEACAYLSQQIQHHIGDTPYSLVGYSLGGRIALYYALHFANPPRTLQKIIVEGANLGLSHPHEKQHRWQNDTFWAKRFQQEPIEQVLVDWYQQPVFSHLTCHARQHLITQRCENNGKDIAHMLLATSLAKQPDFSQKVRGLSDSLYYFYGEQDRKFAAIAQAHHLNHQMITQAGHNAHKENPNEFSQKLTALFQFH